MRRRTFVVGAAGLALAPRADAAPRGLRAAVRGPVFVPGGRGYDKARLVFDTRWDHVRPPAVVRPLDARDVQAVVRWAGDRGVALVARSGGHAYNGASTSDDAVVVDLRHLNGIRSGAVARIGAGARIGDVYSALARHGRGWAAGTCPTVGVGGLALGGGMGFAGRRHGLTLDTIEAVDVVTADGRLRRNVRDGDLFWALRGGGGNFGIVTRLHVRTFAARRAAWCFGSFPRESADEALATWDDVAPRAPREASVFMTMQSDRVTVVGQSFGSEASLQRLIAPLTRIPGGQMSTGSDEFLAVQRRWETPGERTSFAAASLYVGRRLDAAARAAFVDASRTTVLILDAYGGAIADVPAGATAFVHRDARFSVQILSYGAIGPAKARVAEAHRRLAPHGNGEAYQNYPDPSLRGHLHAWYGDNLPRLRAIKRRYDPDDRFRIRQGI